jgi:hypothetical protein
MIEVELTTALALYSVVIGVLVLMIWLYTELSIRRPQRRLGRQFLWRCTFCSCTYLDETAQTLSQCPRCANYNRMEEAAAAPQTAPVLASTADTSKEDPNKPRKGSKRKRRQRKRGGRRRR